MRASKYPVLVLRAIISFDGQRKVTARIRRKLEKWIKFRLTSSRPMKSQIGLPTLPTLPAACPRRRIYTPLEDVLAARYVVVLGTVGDRMCNDDKTNTESRSKLASIQGHLLRSTVFRANGSQAGMLSTFPYHSTCRYPLEMTA